MSNLDFVPYVLDYVRCKAKSFLRKHGIENAYDRIEQSAEANKLSVTDYVNILVNETVREVANHENADWNDVADEFYAHYFSKD